MATKKSAKQSLSRDDKRTSSSKTSRKTLRKTTAAYARRVEDDDDDDKGKKSTAGQGDAGEDKAEAEASTASKPADKDKDKDKAEIAMAGPDALDKDQGGMAAVSGKESGKAEAGQPAPTGFGASPFGAHDAAPPAEQPAAAARVAQAGDASAAPGAEPETRPEPSSSASPAQRTYEPPPPAQASEFAELLPPDAIGDWDPGSPASPPGKAPPGDSRSFRRHGEGGEEFVLIYRHESYLITRAGKVGTQGTWTVVEYPYIGAAAHAYAQECSNFTGAGYRDLR